MRTPLRTRAALWMALYVTAAKNGNLHPDKAAEEAIDELIRAHVDALDEDDRAAQTEEAIRGALNAFGVTADPAKLIDCSAPLKLDWPGEEKPQTVWEHVHGELKKLGLRIYVDGSAQGKTISPLAAEITGAVLDGVRVELREHAARAGIGPAKVAAAFENLRAAAQQSAENAKLLNDMMRGELKVTVTNPIDKATHVDGWPPYLHAFAVRFAEKLSLFYGRPIVELSAEEIERWASKVPYPRSELAKAKAAVEEKPVAPEIEVKEAPEPGGRTMNMTVKVKVDADEARAEIERLTQTVRIGGVRVGQTRRNDRNEHVTIAEERFAVTDESGFLGAFTASAIAQRWPTVSLDAAPAPATSPPPADPELEPTILEPEISDAIDRIRRGMLTLTDGAIDRLLAIELRDARRDGEAAERDRIAEARKPTPDLIAEVERAGVSDLNVAPVVRVMGVIDAQGGLYTRTDVIATIAQELTEARVDGAKKGREEAETRCDAEGHAGASRADLRAELGAAYDAIEHAGLAPENVQPVKRILGFIAGPGPSAFAVINFIAQELSAARFKAAQSALAESWTFAETVDILAAVPFACQGTARGVFLFGNDATNVLRRRGWSEKKIEALRMWASTAQTTERVDLEHAAASDAADEIRLNTSSRAGFDAAVETILTGTTLPIATSVRRILNAALRNARPESFARMLVEELRAAEARAVMETWSAEDQDRAVAALDALGERLGVYARSVFAAICARRTPKIIAEELSEAILNAANAGRIMERETMQKPMSADLIAQTDNKGILRAFVKTDLGAVLEISNARSLKSKTERIGKAIASGYEVHFSELVEDEESTS